MVKLAEPIQPDHTSLAIRMIATHRANITLIEKMMDMKILMGCFRGDRRQIDLPTLEPELRLFRLYRPNGHPNARRSLPQA